MSKNPFSRQGRALPTNVREEIVESWLNKKQPNEIAAELKLPLRTVLNIIERFIDNDGLLTTEIQDQLQENMICLPENVPSRTSISRALKNDLWYTRKKLTVVAQESLTPAASEKLTQFLAICAGIDPNKVHFFDECSVVRNTGNRSYGHAARGKKAIEVQKYASNATITVNLLVNIDGISHVDILPGASNGLELLQFFGDAIEQVDYFGNPVIKPGDIIIMDNCGFHHANHIEPVLRDMLAREGARLVYQPPYHPQFNVCELWFHSLKCWLRKYHRLTEQYMEIATMYGLSNVTAGTARSFYNYCGYIQLHLVH